MLQFENHNKVLEDTNDYLIQVLKWGKAKWELEIYQKRHPIKALIELSYRFPLNRITMVIIEPNGTKNPNTEALFTYDNEIMEFISIEVPQIEGAKWDITTTKL